MADRTPASSSIAPSVTSRGIFLVPFSMAPPTDEGQEHNEKISEQNFKTSKGGTGVSPSQTLQKGRGLGWGEGLLSGTPVPPPQEPPALQAKGAAPVSLGARSPGEWAAEDFSGPPPSILTRLPLACQEPKIAAPCAQQQSTVPYSGSFHCIVALVLLHLTQLHIAIFNQPLIILCPAL